MAYNVFKISRLYWDYLEKNKTTIQQSVKNVVWNYMIQSDSNVT